MGIQDVLRDHPAVGGLVGGIAIGVTSAGIVNIIGGAVKRRVKKRSTTKAKKKTTKKRKSKSTRKKTTTAAQRKRAKAFRGASPKKVFTAKNGQPFIRKANGQVRFISKKSAKSRRKRKGGFR